MSQAPKKRRRLPKNAVELPDCEVMERLFGKRVMKEVDALVSERSDEPESVTGKDDTVSIEEQ